MAVQSQYPTTNAFAQDFRNWSRNDAFDFEEIRQLQGGDRQHMHMGTSLPGAYANNGDMMAFSFSQYPKTKSDLTCNAPASKKRARDQLPSISMAFNQQDHDQDQGMTLLPFGYHHNIKLLPTNTGMQSEQSRLYGSAGTSTSGRPEAVSISSPAISPLAQGVVSHLYNQSAEIDSLIQLQTERLRLGLQETRKRHCRALLSVVEQQAAKLLKEKEAELECASRRNAALEETMKQLAAQSQMWFSVAKNNEAVVSSLRTTLEQVLLQNNMSAACAAPPAEEGYGDSEGISFPADDARSCCFEEESRKATDPVNEEAFRIRNNDQGLRCRRGCCRVCGEREVCMLLLPCRHLCLCKDCETKHDTCPVCYATKNASLRIFLS